MSSLVIHLLIEPDWRVTADQYYENYLAIVCLQLMRAGVRLAKILGTANP